jgi:hypothetical protein
MSTIAATFWLVLVSVSPMGTQHWYMNEFGSEQKCREVMSVWRMSGAVGGNGYGVRCTPKQPMAGVHAYFEPAVVPG